MVKKYRDFIKRIKNVYVYQWTNYHNISNFKDLSNGDKDVILDVQRECDKLNGYYHKLSHAKSVKQIYRKVCNITNDNFGNSLDDIKLDLDSKPLTRGLLQSNISLAILDLSDNIYDDYSVEIDV